MTCHYFDSPRVKDRIWLDVTLPASYASSPNTTYPVVYLTDGYWRRTLHASVHALSAAGEIPETIVVGIGYPNRSNFKRKRERDFLRQPEVLLDCIQHEVLPFIERTYRADPEHRTLLGCSFGGHFLLFAFSEHHRRGGLFETYLCGSPVVSPYPAQSRLRPALRKLMKASPPRANLYLAVGGDETREFHDDYWSIVRQIERHAGGALQFVHEILPQKTHGEMAKPTLLRGLRAFPGAREAADGPR